MCVTVCVTVCVCVCAVSVCLCSHDVYVCIFLPEFYLAQRCTYKVHYSPNPNLMRLNNRIHFDQLYCIIKHRECVGVTREHALTGFLASWPEKVIFEERAFDRSY